MARARVIRPEFWSDEKLASVSRESRLTFAGLWGTSDDYGVTKGNASWLKSQIFPYDEDLKISKFQEWLSELENLRRILPFSVEGEKYYYIPKFKDHQKVDRPSQSKNPKPPEDIESRVTREGVASDSRESSDELEVVTRGCKQRLSKETTLSSADDPAQLENPISQIIAYLNKSTGKNFTAKNKETIRHIQARMSEGKTVQDFFRVIDIKSEKWRGDPKMADFLRPQTLFGTKFESYLNEKPPVTRMESLREVGEAWMQKQENPTPNS